LKKIIDIAGKSNQVTLDKIINCNLPETDGDRMEDYHIADLVAKDVYVNNTLVGRIKGERNHPNQHRVQSLRIEVLPEIAKNYMRRPAGTAPLAKELITRQRDDGTIALSKSMRELQRRWRQTVRINNQLYSLDEMIDRGVCDSDGGEIGIISDLVKIKRTFKAVKIDLHPQVSHQHNLPKTIHIPTSSLDRTRDLLDDVILSKRLSSIIQTMTFAQLNDENTPFEDE